MFDCRVPSNPQLAITARGEIEIAHLCGEPPPNIVRAEKIWAAKK